MNNLTSRFGRITLWLKWPLAAIILWWLFNQFPAAAVAHALSLCQWPFYVPLAVTFVLIWFFIESQNLQWTFGIFGHAISFREIGMIRGASYLLMLVNYNLGLGAMAWYLGKRSDLQLTRTSGVMLYYYFIESIGMVFFSATCSIFLIPRAPIYRQVALFSSVLLLIYVTLFLVLRKASSNRFIKNIWGAEAMATLREASMKDCLTLSFFRSFYLGTFILFFYFGFLSFHVEVPLLAVMTLLPAVFLISSLPLTPFGLGTLQAAMIFFFKDYGPPENILAFSVVYAAGLLIFRAIIGIYFYSKLKAMVYTV